MTVLSAMWQVIEYLKQPALVAAVQQYFGVKLSSDKKSDPVILNPFWYYLFTFGTALGDEIFYASFIPFWFWNIDGAVGRRVVCIWTFVMYIGQGIKDIVKWPRPSHPAKRLQTKWAEEHGMPSTHAMVAVSMPLSVILYTMNRYVYSVPLGGCLAFLWCLCICLSRVYLGMHSVLDIVAGLSLALLLMIPLTPLVDALDHYSMTQPWAPLVIFLIAVIVIILFPHGELWTPTWGDTAMIISVCAGILIGSWGNFQLGNMVPYPQPPPYPVIWPDAKMLGYGALRTLLGFSLIFATRSIFKGAMKSTMSLALGVDINQAKPQSSDAATRRRATVVELTTKFVTYFVIGLNIVFFIPALFRYLGIERPTFYTEI